MRRPKVFSWWPGHPKKRRQGKSGESSFNPPRIEWIYFSPKSPSPKPYRKKTRNLFWRRISMPLGDYIHMYVCTYKCTYMSCLSHRQSSKNPKYIYVSPPHSPVRQQKFAKILLWPTDCRKVCKISQNSQNPWVSRCVLHLAMGTAPKFRSRRECSTSRRLMLAGEANENENENVPERDDGYVSAGVSLPQYPALSSILA